jgi:hypothetical protein
MRRTWMPLVLGVIGLAVMACGTDALGGAPPAAPPSFKYAAVSAQVSQLVLPPEHFFLAPDLISRQGNDKERSLLMLDGTAVARRIPIGLPGFLGWVGQGAGPAGRIAVISADDKANVPAKADAAKTMGVRVQIFKPGGEEEKTYTAQVPDGVEPHLLVGQHVMFVARYFGLHEPGGPYYAAILSPEGKVVEVKGAGRYAMGFQPCGPEAFLAHSSEPGPQRAPAAPKQYYETIDLAGKVRWSQAFPGDDITEAVPSADGKYLVLTHWPSDRARMAANQPQAASELIELASGKRTPGFSTEPAHRYVFPAESVVVVNEHEALRCFGFDGKERWSTQLPMQVGAVGVIHVGGAPALACVGLGRGLDGPFKMEVISLADKKTLADVVLVAKPPEKERDSLAGSVRAITEPAPGRVRITLQDQQFLVDLAEKKPK